MMGVWLFIKDVGRSMTALGWSVLALIIVLALLVVTCAEQDAREARHAAREAKARAAQQERARKADGEAASEARIDAIIVHQKEKELTDAVKGFEDTRLSPARRALNCQRLRQQSGPVAAASAGCPSGG